MKRVKRNLFSKNKFAALTAAVLLGLYGTSVTGAEPRLRYSYMGDQANSCDMRNVQERTHFVLSVGGETELGKGWSIGGDAGFVRGSHDKEWSCSVTVKRMW